jgi:hypothetical protein
VAEQRDRPARKAPRTIAGREPAPAKRQRATAGRRERDENDEGPPSQPAQLDALGRVEARLAEAHARHFDLVDKRDRSQAGLRAVALAHAEVWRLEAAKLQLEGSYDAARKASMSAEGLEDYAAKLERDSHGDRLRRIEQALSARRKAGARLAELDDP